MATSLQFRPQNRDLGMVMRQVDEDLAIFLGQRNDHSALGESHLQFHESKVNVGVETKSGSLSPMTASQEDIVPVSSVDKFIDAEIESTEHKYWLVLQPDPSADPDFPITKSEIPNHEAISDKSKMENKKEKSSTPREDTLSTSTDSSSSTVNKRASSSTKSKPSTPTSRSTLHTPPSRPMTTRSPLIVSKPGLRSATPACKPTSVMPKKHSNNKKVLNVAKEKMLSRSDGCEDVNPVAMGARMVDRVVSMRKLAPPPKEEECVSSRNNVVRKSSSGFGRSLSKKSLDMAIRHMDIGRSISGKLLGQSE